MQHLNPQLQTLMKDVDFKGSQLLLFGEDFGEKAKSRMEAAAALRKVVNPTVPKGKSGFWKATLRRLHRTTRVARQNSMALYTKQRKTKVQRPHKESPD